MPPAEPAQRLRASGVVLAAGAATRMGRPKALLTLGDRCMLQHAIDAALASCLDEVIVVLGDGAAAVRAALRLPADGRVRVVVNPDPAAGQSASLRCGLLAAAASAAAAAVLLGDQPGVTARQIDAVADAFRASGAAAARPVFPAAGGVPGHPVFLARRLWPQLEQLSGDQGARALLAERPEWLCEVPLSGQPPVDVDTPADYERAARAAIVAGSKHSPPRVAAGEESPGRR